MSRRKYIYIVSAVVLLAIVATVYFTQEANKRDNALPIEQADCWYNPLQAGKEYRLCEYDSAFFENEQNQIMLRLPNGNYYVAEKGKADEKATELAIEQVREMKAKKDAGDKNINPVIAVDVLQKVTNKTVVLQENATYVFIYDGNNNATLTPVCERQEQNPTCSAGKMQEYITKKGYNNPDKYILLR
jgi:hypothetical protein